MGIGLLGLAARGSLLALIFLNTFVAPVLLMWYFRRMGYIPDLELDQVRDRRLPYGATFLLYAVTTYLLGFQMDPISYLAPGIAGILGGMTLAIGIVALISLRWKVSAHATAMGGVIGTLCVLFIKSGSSELFTPLMFGLLATGWVLAARLRLNAHTPLQISAGILIGLFVSSVSVWYFI